MSGFPKKVTFEDKQSGTPLSDTNKQLSAQEVNDLKKAVNENALFYGVEADLATLQTKHPNPPKGAFAYIGDGKGYRSMGNGWKPDVAADMEIKFQDLENMVTAIGAGEGGKSYATLAEAQAVDQKPSDGTVFQVEEEANSGYHKFDSTQTGGTKFLRKFIDLSEVRKIEIGSFIQGKYIGSTGAYVNNASYSVTSNIPVSKGMEIEVTQYFSDSAKLIIYKADGTKSRSIDGDGSGNLLYITILEGETYIISSVLSWAESLFKAKIVNLSKSILNAQLYKESEINQLYKSIFHFNFSFIDGAYINSTGSLVSIASYSTTSDITVYEGMEIEVTQYFSDSAKLVIYKSDGTISRYVGGDGTGSLLSITILAGESYIVSSVLSWAKSLFTITLDYNAIEHIYNAKKYRESDLDNVIENVFILKEGKNIPLDFTFQNEFISASDTVVDNTSYSRTDYVPFDYGGLDFTIKVIFADLAVTNFYDENKNKIDSLEYTSEDLLLLRTFTVPEGTKYIISSGITAHIGKLVLYPNSDYSVLDYLNGGVTPEEYDYANITHLFDVQNDSETYHNREYLQSIYPEGFILDTKRDLLVNRMRQFPVFEKSKNTSTKQTFSKNIFIGNSEEGVKEYTIPISYVRTKLSNAKNKTINYLYLGDSIGDAIGTNRDGSASTVNRISGAVKELSEFDNVDAQDIQITTLGTKKQITTSNYKGVDITIRDCNESRSTHALAGYLRHAIMVYTTASANWLSHSAMWDSCGLGTMNGTRSYVAYTDTDADKQLLAETCQGYYAPDYTENLFNNLYLIFQSVADAQGYSTYSVEGCTYLMDYLLNNPKIPFYDKDTVTSSGGAYSFSIAKWMERYKTLENDGVTRLVAGSTAGTKIADVTSVDVCLPTHVTIEFGTNDYTFFKSDYLKINEDIDLLKSILKTEIPSVIIGVLVPRRTGVLNPTRWLDKGVISDFYIGASFNYLLQDHLQSTYGTLAEQDSSKEYLLPVYHVQSPASTQRETTIIDAFDGTEKIVAIDDVTHLGLTGMRSIAYQIRSWLYYTV